MTKRIRTTDNRQEYPSAEAKVFKDCKDALDSMDLYWPMKSNFGGAIVGTRTHKIYEDTNEHSQEG